MTTCTDGRRTGRLTAAGPKRKTDPRILLVDDEPAILSLLQRLLRKAGYLDLHTTTQAGEVPDALPALRPDMLLMDWHMPDMEGAKLLREVRRAMRPGAFVPVVVLTADGTRDVRREALVLGATDFINKPFDNTEVVLRVSNLLHARRLHRQARKRSRLLEDKVRERTRELAEAQREILDRLSQAVAYRDGATGNHTQRVGELAASLAGAIGLPAEEVELIRLAAPLHDLGKIGVPDRILLSPEKLTDEEYACIQTHTVIGGRLLEGGRSPLLQRAEEIARCHHERWDGSGYPAGLKGPAIPLAARIVALADFFDALDSDRPYRPRWPRERILEEIRAQAGRHFDPRLVLAFLGLVRETPAFASTVEV